MFYKETEVQWRPLERNYTLLAFLKFDSTYWVVEVDWPADTWPEREAVDSDQIVVVLSNDNN